MGELREGCGIIVRTLSESYGEFRVLWESFVGQILECYEKVDRAL